MNPNSSGLLHSFSQCLQLTSLLRFEREELSALEKRSGVIVNPDFQVFYKKINEKIWYRNYNVLIGCWPQKIGLKSFYYRAVAQDVSKWSLLRRSCKKQKHKFLPMQFWHLNLIRDKRLLKGFQSLDAQLQVEERLIAGCRAIIIFLLSIFASKSFSTDYGFYHQPNPIADWIGLFWRNQFDFVLFTILYFICIPSGTNI